MHVEIVFPPRVGCTLEVVGGIVDFVAICNMSCLEFSLDAAKPVISVKGLGGVAEDRGRKMNEVIQSHHLITLLGGVTCYDFQQCMRVSAVPHDLHQDLCHSGWRWKSTSFRIIMTLVPAKLTTCSMRHLDDKINVKQS